MEEQPPAAVSVATSALGPVLQKLATLLGDEQHRSRLGDGICRDVESIRSKLGYLHALLLRIWERDDLGAECKEWMTEARALSYDMEDEIDDYMLGSEHSDIVHGELKKLFRNLKTRVDAVSRRCHEEWKTLAHDDAMAIAIKHSKSSPADPRAGFLHKDASELVGMDRPFLELQRLLRDHEMVCIHGFAGTGKTTVADMVYQEFGNEFDCGAFISLSKSPDMMEVLGALLTQVTEGVQSVRRTCTEATPEQNLIHDIAKFLSGKRLCQLVDDDLDFLCNKMPNLQLLTVRLEVLPTSKPIVITGQGFSRLERFCLDCRLPMVTFHQGAMPDLEYLEFKFYTGKALTSENSMGIRHLLSLKRVVFQSSPRYKSDAQGISLVINKVREEAMEHPNKITISVNGKEEQVIQEKKKATTTSVSSDTISQGNIVAMNGGAGGSTGASMIQTRPPIPNNTGTDDDEKRGNIIPVKSYYPFGVAK